MHDTCVASARVTFFSTSDFYVCVPFFCCWENAFRFFVRLAHTHGSASVCGCTIAQLGVDPCWLNGGHRTPGKFWSCLVYAAHIRMWHPMFNYMDTGRARPLGNSKHCEARRWGPVQQRVPGPATDAARTTSINRSLGCLKKKSIDLWMDMVCSPLPLLAEQPRAPHFLPSSVRRIPVADPVNSSRRSNREKIGMMISAPNLHCDAPL